MVVYETCNQTGLFRDHAGFLREFFTALKKTCICVIFSLISGHDVESSGRSDVKAWDFRVGFGSDNSERRDWADILFFDDAFFTGGDLFFLY